MSIKLTSPADMEPDVLQLDKALQDFEAQFKNEEKGLKYYHLVITGELSRPTCDLVEMKYRELGWIAKCRTSSENGERPGLTGLILQLK